MGSPAIALYMNDETDKMRDILKNLKLKEKEQVEI